MKKALLFALPLVAASLVSCSDDDDAPVLVNYDVITFSDCEFAAGKTNNVVSNGGSYTDFDCEFKFAEYYTYVGGCVVSDEHSLNEDKDSTPASIGVAIAPSTDADATPNKFLVVKQPSSLIASKPEAAPEFAFADGEEREVVSIDVMNSSEMYQWMTIGWYSNAPMTDGDWCLLSLTGYDAAGNETGTVTEYLADFRDGNSVVLSEWKTLETIALGKVNKIAVNVTWPDTWDTPYSSPFSVCLDNIKMVQPAEAE